MNDQNGKNKKCSGTVMKDGTNCFDFLLNAHKNLTQIVRFSTKPTIRKQNVAEHSYYVALIAMIVCERLINKGIEIDKGDVLEKCLVHDISESVSGDMPRVVKEENEEIRLMIGNLEDRVFEKITEQLPEDIKQSLHRSYTWFEDRDKLENRIVKFADILENGFFVLCEMDLGNKNMSDVQLNVRRWLDDYDEDEIMIALTRAYCLQADARRKD